MAGRGGRKPSVGFTSKLAAALVMMGAPGTHELGFTRSMAGRGGRTHRLGFRQCLAAAV
jgi:hypothetical protein